MKLFLLIIILNLSSLNYSYGQNQKIKGYNSEGKKIIENKYFHPNESFNIYGDIELKNFANDSISVKPKAQEKKLFI
ncbi:hypothetical protein [Lacinutrix undariae]